MKEIIALLTRIAEGVETLIAERIDPDESLTKAEAARFLRVSPRQLGRFMQAGLKHYPGPRFTRRDLMAFRETMREAAAGFTESTTRRRAA